jgi:uncharacterized damage-inducible protein DinB
MTEIAFIIQQLEDAYRGNPWFGRSMNELFDEVDGRIAFEKTNGQHSIVELLWHMVIWREFTIDRIEPDPEKSLAYFEDNDWQALDHNDRTLLERGLLRLEETQKQLVDLLSRQSDDLLDKQVKERKYNFRKLLHGIIQHDIYHVGQVAYIRKFLVSGF